MTTPTREQIVQWMEQSGFTDYHIRNYSFLFQAAITLARADLEATLELVSHERNNLLETCAKLDITVAEQAKEIERLKTIEKYVTRGETYNYGIRVGIESRQSDIYGLRQQLDDSRAECNSLRRQLAEVS